MFIFALAMLADQWEIVRRPDPITDKTIILARLRGDNAEMIFRCNGDGPPTLEYWPDEFLGGGVSRYELHDFVYRFDGGQPQRESWKYLSDHAVAYSQENAAAFAVKMIKGKKLVVRATRFDNRYIDSTFDLAGSPQTFHDAFEACGIKGSK